MGGTAGIRRAKGGRLGPESRDPGRRRDGQAPRGTRIQRLVGSAPSGEHLDSGRAESGRKVGRGRRLNGALSVWGWPVTRRPKPKAPGSTGHGRASERGSHDPPHARCLGRLEGQAVGTLTCRRRRQRARLGRRAKGGGGRMGDGVWQGGSGPSSRDAPGGGQCCRVLVGVWMKP